MENSNNEVLVAGVAPSSWPNSQRGPTIFDVSTLSASQVLFIKAMRFVESVETPETIESLNLPSQYTGKTMQIMNEIETETQWDDTLHALLEAIEYEKQKSYADTYITALFAYAFPLNYVNGSFDPTYTL